MTSATISRPRPATDPPKSRTGILDWIFVRFLKEQGYKYLLEPMRFPLGDDHCGTARAMKPDVQIVELPTGEPVTDLYIELTEADFYVDASLLPSHVLDKNLVDSESGQPHIAPADYLAKKRRKIREVQRRHHVRIVLLTYQDQADILVRPSRLDEILAPYLPTAIARASRAA